MQLPEKISKNRYKGVIILSLDQICYLAAIGKSIYFSNWKKCIPAAFVQNWQGRRIQVFIDRQVMFHAIKIEKDEEWAWLE